MLINTVLQVVLLLILPVNAQYFPVTGVRTNVSTTGARPSRRNILDMQNDAPTWSLYIQALNAMQNMDENDQLSYFQIAAIHGRPFIPWNNVGQVPRAPLTGYCTHSSVLFLTWHRPYLALFEQLLASHVQTIAQTYSSTPSSSIYQNAANNFRIPYWDWAAVNSLPPVVTQPFVTITTPSGTQSVVNPLFQYKFKTFPLNSAWFPPSDGPVTRYPNTVRGAQNAGGGNNFARVNINLGNSNLKQNTYNTFSKSTTFDLFATTATQGPAIEGVHNNVHSNVGDNTGHMNQLSYSAFDPLFWLHHANIDRLFALWQTIYPNQYLTQWQDQQGTFTIPAGSLDTMNTLLEPFSSNGRQFYTSASAWQTSTFGYTYPEIQDWSPSTPAQLRTNSIAAINKLYNPTGAFKRAGMPIALGKEWSVSLNVSKFDLEGERFIIRVFLGAVPQDPSQWAASSGCVGSVPVFPPPHTSNAPYPSISVYGEVDLTRGLGANGIDVFDLETTEKWLTEHLHWRVQKFDGSVVPNEQVPSLGLTVMDEDITHPRDATELPKYGTATLYPGITKGRSG